MLVLVQTWNPVWSVGTILVGLLSFMLESANTVGSITTDDAEKRRLARASLEYNVTHDRNFVKLFPDLVEMHMQRKAAAAAAVAEASRLAASTGAAPRAAPPATDNSTLASAAFVGILLLAIVVAWWQRNRAASQESLYLD